MSSKLKYCENLNVTKTDMSPKQKCHQDWVVTKTELSPKLICHQSWNVFKAAMSPKLKCNLNFYVTKTKTIPKLKCHQSPIFWHLIVWMFKIYIWQPDGWHLKTTWRLVMALKIGPSTAAVMYDIAPQFSF